MDFPQEGAFPWRNLDDVPLREAHWITVEHKAAHDDILAIDDAEKRIPRIADDFRTVALDGDARGAVEGEDGIARLAGETIALLLKNHLRSWSSLDRRRQRLAHRRSVIGLAVTDCAVVRDFKFCCVEKRRSEQCRYECDEKSWHEEY